MSWRKITPRSVGIAVGTGIALGAAYYYFGRRSKPNKAHKRRPKCKRPACTKVECNLNPQQGTSAVPSPEVKFEDVDEAVRVRVHRALGQESSLATKPTDTMANTVFHIVSNHSDEDVLDKDGAHLFTREELLSCGLRTDAAIKQACNARAGDFVFVNAKKERHSAVVASEEEVLSAGGVVGYAETRLRYEEEVFVVVGDMDGLEQELCDDIVLVCASLHILDKAAQIIESITTTTNTSTAVERAVVTYPINGVADKGRLHVLVEPTAKEFEDNMLAVGEAFLGHTLRIFYCGHGSSDGSIVLADGQYRGHEFAQFLQRDAIAHWPDIVFVANCCFAVHFFASGSGTTVDSLLSIFRRIDPVKTEKVLRAQDPLSDSIQLASNELMAALLSEMGSSVKSGIPLEWGDNIIWGFPLSMGPQSAIGAIDTYLDADGKQQLGALREKYKYAGHSRARWFEDWSTMKSSWPDGTTMIVPETAAVPELLLLQGGKGDSTLLRFGPWNILVDGGKSTTADTIPLWPTVNELRQLDLVLLTHGDSDHINGLEMLFRRKRFEKEHKSPAWPEIGQLALLADTKHGAASRAWWHSNRLFKIASEAGVNMFPPQDLQAGHTIFSGSVSGYSISVDCVLPSADDHELAMAKLGRAGASRSRLTPINKWGVVAIATCKGRTKEWRMLFTGDADGETIVSALKNQNHGDHFDYVNVPHHGSASNSPKKFFKYISASVFVISTNGKYHWHPDTEVLKELGENMQRHRDSHVYFTYKKHGSDARPRASVSQELEDLGFDMTRVHFPDDVVDGIAHWLEM